MSKAKKKKRKCKEQRMSALAEHYLVFFSFVYIYNLIPEVNYECKLLVYIIFNKIGCKASNSVSKR